MLRTILIFLLFPAVTICLGILFTLIALYEDGLQWLLNKVFSRFRSPSSYTYDEYFAKELKRRKRRRDD